MNREWSFYDATTGVLSPTRASLPARVDPASFAPGGHLAIEGRFDPLTQLIEPATATAVAWTRPAELVIDDLKAEAWERIKTLRDAAMSASLATPYGTFDADRESRSNITDAVLMMQTLTAMGQTPTIDFTLADNTDATLTVAEMVTVGLLLGQQVQAAYATGRALRTALDAATTADEVEAIAWPS